MRRYILREFGLTDNEITVYLSLLRIGKSSITPIADKTGMHRQVIYNAIRSLEEKKLVTTITNGTSTFEAIHPSKLLQLYQEKEQHLTALVPRLKALMPNQTKDTIVEVYQGAGALKTVYRDVLKAIQEGDKDIVIFGCDEQRCVDDDDVGVRQHLNKIRELGGRERIFLKEGDTFVLQGPQTTYRWVPEELYSPAAIHVYGNKVALGVYGNPNYEIIIKNKELAESFRKHFNLIWKTAKPLPKGLQTWQQKVPKDA
jgi:predicted transcriptional regulator